MKDASPSPDAFAAIRPHVSTFSGSGRGAGSVSRHLRHFLLLTLLDLTTLTALLPYSDGKTF